MRKLSFEEALEQIIAEDTRYRIQAYYFIREALDFTIRMMDKPVEGPGRHVTGQELLAGIRRYALHEYGPVTQRVLKHWGIETTDDIGNIVFNLVDKGILGKTDTDQREDVSNGYDFDEAFRKPFTPKTRPGALDRVESPPKRSS